MPNSTLPHRQRPSRDRRGVNQETMKYTFKAPTLTPGKRSMLERTAEWIKKLASDLEAPKARLDELDLALAKAQARKVKYEKDAALNPDAALQLTGAEAQISRLSPQVASLRKSLERQTETAIQQVNITRSTDVRELLFGPLLDQLVASIEAAISPFFADGWARQHARNIAQHNCPQYRALMFYLNRPPITLVEFEDAKREITAFGGEIQKILAGETIFEA